MDIKEFTGELPKLTSRGRQKSPETLQLIEMAKVSLSTGKVFEVQPSPGQKVESLRVRLHQMSSELKKSDGIVLRTRSYGPGILFWAESVKKETKAKVEPPKAEPLATVGKPTPRRRGRASKTA
jgi:hypothetical protein